MRKLLIIALLFWGCDKEYKTCVIKKQSFGDTSYLCYEGVSEAFCRAQEEDTQNETITIDDYRISDNNCEDQCMMRMTFTCAEY